MIRACDCVEGAWYPHLIQRGPVVFLSCSHCYGYAPICAATDDGEHAAAVAIEVRAADLSSLARSHATTSESHGWNLCGRDADLPAGLEDDPEYVAGYLARIIFEHDRSAP